MTNDMLRRNEDTAIPAIDEMAETVAADLREFNQDLPVEIRPAMQRLPAVTDWTLYIWVV